MMAGVVPITRSLKDIYTLDALEPQTKRWERLLQAFQTTYGHPATFVTRSPGRLNIIGEHIDYSLYSVLPMAISADCLLAVSSSSESSSSGTFRLHLTNVEADKFPPHYFEIPNNDVEIDSKVHEWTNYFKCGLKGALEILRNNYGAEFRPRSINVLMDGSVPPGGGLSSSAAFVSASALAVMVANGEKEVDKTTLTELAIVSERNVGVNSGGMDQSASVFSMQGSALFVSFVPSLTVRPIHFPKTYPELSFLVAQSFVAADKHVTGPVCYNLRVVECSLAAAYMHTVLNGTSSHLKRDSGPLGISLRGFHDAYFTNSPKPFDEQLADLVALTEATLTQECYTRSDIAAVLGISVSDLEQRYESTFPVRAEKFKLRQRALHVFSEALRVRQFLRLLEHPSEFQSYNPGDSTESYNHKLGELMNQTQDSCHELYECSCPELDELCAIARKAGSYGSRLTGAGWGGCSVHLVPADKIEVIKEAWEREYYSKLKGLTDEQRDKAVVVSRPGGGSTVFLVGEAGVL